MEREIDQATSKGLAPPLPHDAGKPDTEIEIRWVARVDAFEADAIVALVNATVDDGGTLGYANPLSAEEAAKFIDGLRLRIAAGATHALLGLTHGQPVFFVQLSPNAMPNCRHLAELSKGVVHPEFRGKRLVKVGFRAIVERARALGIEILVLDVREDTRAHALWSRFGFCTYGVLEDYARYNGRSHRGHFMYQRVEDLARMLEAEQIASLP